METRTHSNPTTQEARDVYVRASRAYTVAAEAYNAGNLSADDFFFARAFYVVAGQAYDAELAAERVAK